MKYIELITIQNAVYSHALNSYTPAQRAYWMGHWRRFDKLMRAVGWR